MRYFCDACYNIIHTIGDHEPGCPEGEDDGLEMETYEVDDIDAWKASDEYQDKVVDEVGWDSPGYLDPP